MIKHRFKYPGLSENQLEQFDKLAGHLVEMNKIHNLTTITAAEDIYSRHFVDSLAPVQLIEELAGKIEKPKLLDAGSGAGFPALPLAIALPNWHITSLDATGKKIRFQQQAAFRLGLENFEPLQQRAEIIANQARYREKFDIVTARALASLNVLAELTLPLVRPGGHFLAWKGPDPQEEVDAARDAIELLGGRVKQFFGYQLAEDRRFNIVVVEKVATTPAEYPREYKNIKASPLGN